MRSLSLFSSVCLLALTSVNCGENAESRFAGLDVRSVDLPDGSGYRLRYLSPPWELASDDPFVTEKQPSVRVGSRSVPIEVGSASVLAIDRTRAANESAIPPDPKYRLEVAIVRCPQLAAGASCARALADEDAAVNGSEGVGVHVAENDFGQKYYDFLGFESATVRSQRTVYIELENEPASVRLFFEANPPLAEAEVTQMIEACEAVAASQAAAAKAGLGVRP